MSDEMVRLSNIKIYRAAFPELVAELDAISPRHRADRLRVLANLGLLVLRTGLGDSMVSQLGDQITTHTPVANPQKGGSGEEAKPPTSTGFIQTPGPAIGASKSPEQPPDETLSDTHDNEDDTSSITQDLKNRSNISPKW